MRQSFKGLLTVTALASCICVPAMAMAQGTAFPVAGRGGVRFDLSEQWIGAINTANHIPSALGATRFGEDFETGGMWLEAGIVSADVVYDNATQALSVASIRSDASFKVSESALLPSGKRGGSPRIGGWLSLSNMEVDFAARAIYADVAGDHGVAPTARQHIWSFSKAEGSVVRETSPSGDQLVLEHTIEGLSITEQGFSLMAQGMALSQSLGIPSFRGITDYGTIRTTLMVDTQVIPEPATWALMGIGLIGLASRHRTRRPSGAGLNQELS